MLQQVLSLIRSAMPYVEMAAFFSPTFDLLWDRFVALQIWLAEQSERPAAPVGEQQDADEPRGSEQLQRIREREQSQTPTGMAGLLFRYRYFFLSTVFAHVLGAHHVWDILFAQSRVGGVLAVAIITLIVTVVAFLATPPITSLAVAWIMNRIIHVGPQDRDPLDLPVLFWPSVPGALAANVTLAAGHVCATLLAAYLVGSGAVPPVLARTFAFFVIPLVLGFLAAWRFNVRAFWLCPSLLLGFAVWIWYSVAGGNAGGPQQWLFLPTNAVALVLCALLGGWLGWKAHSRR